MDWRKVIRGHSRIGRPSTKTELSGASQRRAMRAASVVLPFPVGPTRGRAERQEIFRLMSWSTGRGALPLFLEDPFEPAPEMIVGYVKVRWRNSISPRGLAPCGTFASRSSILGWAVRM